MWVAVLLVVALLAGSGSSTAATMNDVLTYGVGVDATTLDPQMVDNIPTANVVMHIHESLVEWDKGFKQIQPSLAESWATSADGKEWTFALRKGVKFQDGASLDARAVKATFDRILDPKTASPRRSVYSMITRIDVVDDTHVKLVTDRPFGPMLPVLATYNIAIMSPKAIQESGKDYAKKPMGTGPYKFASWTPGDKLVLERNDAYWGPKPTLRQIVFKVIPEDTTRVMALTRGDVDIISNVSPVMVEHLKQDKNIVMTIAPSFRTIYIGMNFKMKPLDNVKVRQAINYAINREAIAKGLLRGLVDVAVGPEAPWIPGSTDKLTSYPYDPAKAKQLLAEAGFPKGFSTTLYSPVGRYMMDKQVAEAVQSQLAQVGIKAEYKTVDWSILTDLLKKGQEDGLYLLGKGSPSADLDLTGMITFKAGGSNNYMFVDSPEIDKLLDAQRGEVNTEKRHAILRQYLEAVQQLAPWASLHYEKQLIAARSNVQGLRVVPNEFIDLRYVTKQ